MIIYNTKRIKYRTDYFILIYNYCIFTWGKENRKRVKIGVPLKFLTKQGKKYLETFDRKLTYVPNIQLALEVICPFDINIINEQLKNLYNKEGLQQFNDIYKQQEEYIQKNINKDIVIMNIIEKYLLGI